MGGTLSFNPIFNLTFSFFLVTITTTVIFIVADADDDSRESPPSFPSFQNSTNRVPSTNGISTGNSNNLNRKSQPLKPSTIIVVGVLTTLFSLTFIFLLYIKHCIHRNNENQSHQEGEPLQRNDSGIDRGVVEKLPIFRFGSLRGQKEGLDCAVCLNRFEHTDVLRLLPICNHAFHVDCVDKWFDAHSTCPLCRNRVELKDIVPREQLQEQGERDELVEDIERGTFRRVSGRHSSVLGEREGGFLEIITHNSNEKKNKKMKSSSSTRSFHSSSRSFGGFVRPRKDKTLMARQGQEGNFSNNNNRGSNAEHHRLQHQIIIDSPVASFVSSNGKGESSSSHPHHR
ncbi:Putative RING-H2 finger protein [Arachis hypogaea]|nr:Putative RING-H2 finger protein [Arachis hypogaea]